MTEAAAASCVFQGDSEPADWRVGSAEVSSTSSASGSDADAAEREESDDSDDNFGADALPRDRASLQHELARLDHVQRRLQLETDADFVLGCVRLRDARRQRVASAHAALERRQAAARHVLQYAEATARETHARRCTDLRREMNADMKRELRRLQTAKDGVSVTSRRRRAVRDDTPPAKSSGNGMRRRRTMYASDGDDDGPEDVFLASASPQERAHRVEFQEKKRLKRLLGRASVFKPVVKQVTAQEIAEDLEAIRTAVPCDAETTASKADRKHKNKKQQHQPKKKQQQKKEKPTRRRPRIITPRRIPHASALDVPASSIASSQVMANAAAKSRRTRLQYNPRMLQEGQEVEVFKRQRTQAAAGDEDEGKDENRDECVMSGIITAATATQVYVLTVTGRFESFNVRDCVVGSLYVRALEGNDSPANSVRPG
ncbi:Peptidyl-prolyl cis-trans isomerase [Phytophthora cinnamomi]|uniref:Peptidyl-prolyl cis-trans isomerase n=1 Tax=Phytophthora cinnamomi TaxID=4785 RepID=UPI003559C605|nr:Peptidyl-prolyl cis-trans isomerase [Phytophthora cinnamomi]